MKDEPAVGWLLFSNPGEIDLRSLTTFGVNSKPRAEGSAIGYFGTGLKYALSIIARLGGEVIVQRGLEEFWLNKTMTDFREKQFEQLCLDKESGEHLLLPFTTELGKDWENWWAYRELWSNAKDEGGWVDSYEEINSLDSPAGQTNIWVKCPELWDVYLHSEKFFLEFDPAEDGMKPLWRGEFVELWPLNEHILLAYNGVKMLKSYNYSVSNLFTYNVIGEGVGLTEDRTFKNPNEIVRKIAQDLMKNAPKEVLEQVLEEKGGFEEELDFNQTAPTEISDEFVQLVLEMLRNKKLKNRSARDRLHNKFPKEIAEAERFKLPGLWKELEEAEPGKAKVNAPLDYYLARTPLYDLENERDDLRKQVKFWKEAAMQLWEEREGGEILNYEKFAQPPVEDDEIPY